MNALVAYTQSWRLFGAEIGLTVLALLILFFELFGKTDSQKLIRFSIIGCFLIFVILYLLWPFSGRAFHGSFVLDPFAILLKVIFLGSGILTLFMALEYSKSLDGRSSDFCLLILVSVLGAFFLASSGDLITLFITIEWMTLSLYILTAYLKTDDYSLEAGTKYLIMGAFSSALFLFGISLVYGMAGGVRFDQIRQALAVIHAEPLFLVGILLILSGIGFKIAVFPFQLWVPDVYQGAPTPITAFLSSASKTAGFAALLKILFLATDPKYVNWSTLMGILCAATLLYGNLGALGQTNMKRLFAYSSIGHAGYLLMGIACGNELGIQATLFYLIAYAISNLAAFLVIVIANRELGSGETIAYRGLARKAPFLAGS
ncbi:MAG: NADH-quinone oxidoreductase subunit N, partial [Candidatus Omnitrophica bacterium]|nr:NADH-quinone oxidoreductase subunit N [Candidatus Omnitrophota bacterium]